MGRRLRRGTVLLALLPVALLMCASATEIDVDVYSEIACSSKAEVGLVMGKNLTDLGSNAVTSTTLNCDASQRVGRIVISPSGSNDEELAFQVVTRNDGQGVESCTAATNYKGCIDETPIPTGLAQQTHLIFAEGDCRYWFFYVGDDTSQVHTRVSPDLVHWSEGPPITFAQGDADGNGGNFSVAYANVNGVDVVHLVIDQPVAQTGYAYDLRFTLTGAPGAAQPSSIITTPLFDSALGWSSGDACRPTVPRS